MCHADLLLDLLVVFFRHLRCLVLVFLILLLVCETKAERKRRIAKERKEAKALADRLLAEYGADDMPDDVANEIADEFAELDGEF